MEERTIVRVDAQLLSDPRWSRPYSGLYWQLDAVDAWGRPLRLLCPGFANPRGYDLMSDGPDGVLGGLDRVE